MVCPCRQRGISRTEQTKDARMQLKDNTLRKDAETRPATGSKKAPASGTKMIANNKAECGMVFIISISRPCPEVAYFDACSLFVRALKNSTNAGIIEMPMINNVTREKFSFTIGILPK